MNIKDKIKSAKTDGWLAEGLTDEEIKEAIRLAKTEALKVADTVSDLILFHKRVRENGDRMMRTVVD